MSLFESKYSEKNKITNKIQTFDLTLLAVGNQNGNIMIFDMSNYRYAAIMKQKVSIVKLAFTGDHPLLCAADENGKIYIYAVKPSILAYKNPL